MSAYRRNILVGMTVITALGVLGWMFLRFGAKTANVFAPPQATVTFDAPQVTGISEGSGITYLGVSVGRVIKLDRKPDGSGVIIEALVVTDPPVPSNVTAEIVTTNLIGGGSQLSLETTGPPTFNPPIQVRQMIPTHYVGLRLNIVPAQFGETADKIATAADEIAKISHDLRTTGFVEHLDETVKNVNEQTSHMGDVLKDVHNVLGDEKVQTDVRTAVANFREAAEKANGIATDLKKLSENGRLDALASSAGDRLQQLSKLLDSASSIAAKLDRGEGTAGQLLNDTKLYQSLLDASRQVNLMIQDLRRLAGQWEQEGVTFKLH
jgi:phospholipid/cholesterol/gamma-HCH transport system substrate-binding protein